MISEEETKAFL
jgi:hypothetical protein